MRANAGRVCAYASCPLALMAHKGNSTFVAWLAQLERKFLGCTFGNSLNSRMEKGGELVLKVNIPWEGNALLKAAGS